MALTEEELNARLDEVREGLVELRQMIRQAVVLAEREAAKATAKAKASE